MFTESTPQGTNAIIASGNHVLTIHDDDYGVRFPGGTLDPDLDIDLEHCCSREVLEETGVIVAANGLARVMSYYTVTEPVKPGHSPEFTDHYLFGLVTQYNPPSLVGSAQWLRADLLADVLAHPIDRMAFKIASQAKLPRD